MFPSSRIRRSRRACVPKHSRLASTYDSAASGSKCRMIAEHAPRRRLASSPDPAVLPRSAPSPAAAPPRLPQQETEVIRRLVEGIRELLVRPRIDRSAPVITVVPQPVNHLPRLSRLCNCATSSWLMSRPPEGTSEDIPKTPPKMLAAGDLRETMCYICHIRLAASFGRSVFAMRVSSARRRRVALPLVAIACFSLAGIVWSQGRGAAPPRLRCPTRPPIRCSAASNSAPSDPPP